MASAQEGIGCRDSALATSFLLGSAIALFALGLTLVNRETCIGWCETFGLTALYAGGPVSAVFGVLTDSVVVAWPLDVTLWVILGFLIGRSGRRPPLVKAVLVIVGALIFGLVLSQLVEIDRVIPTPDT